MLAGFGLQATQISHGAESIDAALMNQRRGSRSAGMGDLVRAVIVVLPKGPAIKGIQTQDSLIAGDTFARRPQGLAGCIASPRATHQVHAAVRDRRSAVV